jgi:hypothetical protein
MLIQLLEQHRSSTAIAALQREMIREDPKGVVPENQRLSVFSALFSQPYLRNSANQTFRLKKNDKDRQICLFIMRDITIDNNKLL